MNEFQSAIGLIQLNHINKVIENRRSRYIKYASQLDGIKEIVVPKLPDDLEYNFAYFPVYITKGSLVREKSLNH